MEYEMRFYNEPVISAANAATNQNSIAVDSKLCRYASLQVVTTGTAAGSVKLQVSNDDNGSVTNWSDLTGATVSVSGANVYLIPAQNMSYQYVRAVYTVTSGTGTITATMHMVGY
jgi:hypothetical protein